MFDSKVIVIGAGIAGLTAAYRLWQKGVDVQIFEARNRVGGRILTAKVKGYIAELGGQNFSDGGDAENIHRLIKEWDFEVLEKKVTIDFSYFEENRFICLQTLLQSKKFKKESLRDDLDKIIRQAKNMKDVLKGFFKEEDPLYKALSVRLAGYEGASPEKLSSLYGETLYHMLLGGIAAAHQIKEEDEQIHFFSLKEGNGQLPEKIAQILGKRLHLNQALKSVSRDQQGFTLNFQGGMKAKGEILALAIPCSVYRDISFEKEVLPLERLNMMRKIPYGRNAKILVPFSVKPSTRKSFLNDQMGCFFSIDQNILTLYYTEEASAFSRETIVETYLKDRAMLERGFGERCPPFSPPVLAKDESFVSYEGPVGYSWPNDPYVKGSYSYIPPGMETILTATEQELGETVKSLFAPIDQKLYFAGEHTSILAEVPGTIEAACESGERLARMILRTL